ncbi:MAG: type II toxin-antitoxin system RelB/DinJ family antitoxin [Ruminococcus sp.]|nr:type II toxin-antitoxin system RelB/DinJ family antitoxin [Ruminococcus sp.]
MARTSQVSFRIDEDVKKSAERALDDMGLTISAAITVFLKKVGREHRIPFEISADPFYFESNMHHLNNIIDGIENGTRPLVEHDLIEVEEAETE